MNLFQNKKTGGFMDEIRCDEHDYLIWKWHPRNVPLGTRNRENAIRWGSSLRVKDGEVAVFVYPQKDNKFQEIIVGPFDQIIKTKNFPILASIVGLAYEGGTPFQAEIYFINTAKIIHMKFGVPYFTIFDPRFLDFGIPVAVRGSLNFQITDYNEFIKLHRLNNFSLADFQNQIRSALARYIKNEISHTLNSANIPAIQIGTKINDINNAVSPKIIERLHNEFGVSVSSLDIESIEVDQTDENYSKLMRVTQNITSTRLEAELKDYTETLRINREESQYATHKQTQSANIGAFQVEQQAEVAKAGAHALGKMGEHNAGNINLSDGSAGFNPMAMMAGMTLGGAIGQNMANTINGVATQHTSTQAPPPIPQTVYFVVQNNTQTGPFDTTQIQQLIYEKTIIKDTLMWTAGMSEWQSAKNIPDINRLLIPDIPQ